MAQEAEALREKRARIIKAEAELEVAGKLRAVAALIMANPAGLELRRTEYDHHHQDAERIRVHGGRDCGAGGPADAQGVSTAARAE